MSKWTTSKWMQDIAEREIQTTKLEIASEFLKMGLSADKVAKGTRLSLEQVQELEKKLILVPREVIR